MESSTQFSPSTATPTRLEAPSFQPPHQEPAPRDLKPVDRHRKLQRTIYPPVIGQGLKAAAMMRVMLWDRALDRVKETQEQMLLDFVQHAKDTEFGRRYGFSTMRRYE